MIKFDFLREIFSKDRKISVESSSKIKKSTVYGSEIKFNKVKSFLENKEKISNNKLKKDTSPLIEDIISSMDELKKLAKDLDKRKLGEDIPKRAKKVITTSKPPFVKGIIECTKGLPGEGGDVEIFHKKLKEKLYKIGKLLAGSGRYLPFSFSKDMEKITKKSKEILVLDEKLSELIAKSSDKKIIKSSLELYDRINDILKEKNRLKEKRIELKKELLKRKNSKQVKERMLDEIKNSTEFKEFKNIEKKIVELIKRKDEIETEVYNNLSPLKRPLKKFKRYLLDENKGSKRLVEEYLGNPSLVFLTGESVSELKGILTEIINAASKEGKLSLKSQEITKVKGVFLNFEKLQELKKEYLEVKSREKEIQSKIKTATIIKNKTEIESEMELIIREMEERREEIIKINTKESELKERLDKTVHDLEKMISEIEGKEVSII